MRQGGHIDEQNNFFLHEKKSSASSGGKRCLSYRPTWPPWRRLKSSNKVRFRHSLRRCMDNRNPWSLAELGTLSSDDGDENEDVQKAIGLIAKTTILHLHHAFWYISFPSLHDYDVRMPNFTLYRGRTQATTKFPPSFWTWIWFLRIQR